MLRIQFPVLPLSVLVEKSENGFAERLTENYLRAQVRLLESSANAGDVALAQVEEWDGQ